MARKVGTAVIACFMGQVGEHDDIGGFFNVQESIHRSINGLHGQGSSAKITPRLFAVFGIGVAKLFAGGCCC